MTIAASPSTTLKNLTHKSAGVSGVALLSLLPSLAVAHSGHALLAADAPFLSSIVSGILHPLTGFDHLMLALGMGLLFSQMHRFKQGLVALLVGLMVGFTVSLSISLNSTFIEYGILLSIVVLTVALMSRYFNDTLKQNHKTSIATWHNLAIIGFGALAMFHGAAHAIEVPTSSSTAGFFIGMIVAMLGLYTAGKGVASYINTHLEKGLIIQRIMAVVGLCAVLLS